MAIKNLLISNEVPENDVNKVLVCLVHSDTLQDMLDSLEKDKMPLENRVRILKAFQGAGFVLNKRWVFKYICY